MKRGRKRKPKPHETLDGLKSLALKAAIRRGHKLLWNERENTTTEGIAVCGNCRAIAVIVLQPAGIENVITGLAVNRECPNRQQELTT
jgi:hypothetical protein